MRNPKSFSRGSADLTEICRLARQQGSLLARKFTLTTPLEAATAADTTDTKPVEDLEGYISYEAWDKIMEDAVPLAEGL
jgi:hypothetical protein